MAERVRRIAGVEGVPAQQPEPGELLQRVARGDESAFERLYDIVSAPVFGLVRRVVRDPAQSEEVTQEVMLELWRTAARYAPEKGGAMTWVMTLAHRRAVDRVRSAQSATDREDKAYRRETTRPFDEVAEQVGTRLEHQQVRRCLASLTDLQRESVELAYYRGMTYREVSELLDTPLGTIKTRLRDGLIRLRDCLGVGR
ncbi:sigma-70 family RNA polymerase sigma factor [Actinokineospora sp. HUAS TT18]|uniref:sigma-70 family RNA polymerase sigma factor n=1 Tax=Actinokineospora sp. HUAS TT18 TaxID=3447451 RepID=UPI003F527AAC